MNDYNPNLRRLRMRVIDAMIENAMAIEKSLDAQEAYKDAVREYETARDGSDSDD